MLHLCTLPSTRTQVLSYFLVTARQNVALLLIRPVVILHTLESASLAACSALAFEKFIVILLCY
jgi:hypothetical protein